MIFLLFAVFVVDESDSVELLRSRLSGNAVGSVTLSARFMPNMLLLLLLLALLLLLPTSRQV